MYLKFEDAGNHIIKGGCTAENHVEELEIMSWNHGFSQPTSPVRSSAGGGTVEQANHSDISFTKYLDSSSTALIKYCWTGNHIPLARFTFYRADGDDAAPGSAPVAYLTIEATEVIVANYSIGGMPGDIPVETISLNYGSVKYIYKPQKKKDAEAGTAGDQVPIKHDLINRKIE
jgi:type VI secretion system secreted protein Hcp